MLSAKHLPCRNSLSVLVPPDRSGADVCTFIFACSDAATGAGLGAMVVELDSSVPFGPARARNEGARLLLSLDPGVQFIQFIDGDCELRQGWIAAAARQLREDPRAAIVAGRLRERSPDASLYNRLCDIEWD